MDFVLTEKNPLEDFGIDVTGYKCFGDSPVGFNQIHPINILVGRNNSGKSSLLDLLAFVLNGDDSIFENGHRSLEPEIYMSATLTEEALKTSFIENHSDGPIRGNHWQFGQQFAGKRATWKIAPNKQKQLVQVNTDVDISKVRDKLLSAAQILDRPLSPLTFRRLSADRDVTAEGRSTDNSIAANGRGFTTAVANFLLRSNLPTELIEDELLHRLNSVYAPATTFRDITVQERPDGSWEIYLGEDAKGRVPLSRSGSGLKTILLVLACIHLVPRIEGRTLGQYVFGFEELENNLHPALQRRLGTYLREVCLSAGCVAFLTTHSNVIIDQFANDPEAQVVHVTHNGTFAAATRISAYAERGGILDDLDVRASDLLQANGIIWVEGPSDRLYIRRWLDLISNHTLLEGTHYQIVFYGGRLLAHLAAATEDQENAGKYLQILSINRNAILVMDSDFKGPTSRLNATKRRMKAQVEAVGGISWTTSGREIENYVPRRALQELFPTKKLGELGRFEPIAEYLGQFSEKESKRFLANKALFAERVLSRFTRGDISDALDLEITLTKLMKRVERWNDPERFKAGPS